MAGFGLFFTPNGVVVVEGGAAAVGGERCGMEGGMSDKRDLSLITARASHGH